jgi:hypothetical protein
MARQIITRKDTAHTRLNNELGKVETAVKDLFAHASLQAEPVTPDALMFAIKAVIGRKPTPSAKPAASVPPPLILKKLHDYWRAENPHQGRRSDRRYKQVITHLEAFHPGFALDHLNRRM